MSIPSSPAAHARTELQERLQDRAALFELADRVGVPHRGVRVFAEGQEGIRDLLRFLDLNRGQEIESPWWVSSQDAREGLDRWCPAREIQSRDRESWRLAERYPGGWVLESALEGARRLRLHWRRTGVGGAFEFGRVFDVSLSEGMGPFGPVARRLNLAVSPPPAVDPGVIQVLESEAIKLLEALAARGEGSLDFFVDGDRVFLAGGEEGLTWGLDPWSASVGIEVVGWVHPVESFTGLPQPGVVRVLRLPEGAQAGPSVAPGQWTERGALVAVSASSEALPGALTALSRILEGMVLQGGLQTSAPLLRDLCSNPWVQEGLFHFRYLEEEFVPRSPSVSSDELEALTGLLLQSEPGLLGQTVVMDGRICFLNAGGAASGFPGTVEKLGEGVWLVSHGDISKLVRLRQAVAPRELRALCAGRVLDICVGVPAWNGGAVLVLESHGSWVPHAVSSTLAPALRWLVSAGQCVHRGQVLARLS